MNLRIDKAVQQGGNYIVNISLPNKNGAYPVNPSKITLVIPVATAAQYRSVANAMIPYEAVMALALADWVDAGKPALTFSGKEISILSPTLTNITNLV